MSCSFIMFLVFVSHATHCQMANEIMLAVHVRNTQKTPRTFQNRVGYIVVVSPILRFRFSWSGFSVIFIICCTVDYYQLLLTLTLLIVGWQIKLPKSIIIPSIIFALFFSFSLLRRSSDPG